MSWLFLCMFHCVFGYFFSRSTRKIQPVNITNIDGYKVTTCFRISSKEFELEEFDLKFSLANIDPSNGTTIAASQNEKFDKMREWPKSPFREYQCNKRSAYFVTAKKY